MVNYDEEKILKKIQEKGLDEIKKNPKAFCEEIGIRATDKQAERIGKQLELLVTNAEKQVLNIVIFLGESEK